MANRKGGLRIIDVSDPQNPYEIGSYTPSDEREVSDVDLYVPGLNFVFGEADILKGIAIISLARLREEFYGLPSNEDLFKERALKEAVHELGHLYGLRHCTDPDCVMNFSNTLYDTDRKSCKFCFRHREAILKR